MWKVKLTTVQQKKKKKQNKEENAKNLLIEKNWLKKNKNQSIGT